MSTDAMSDDTPTRSRKSGGARSSARRGRRSAGEEGLAIASAAKERALDAASSAADRIEDEVERRKERETDRLARVADAIGDAGDALEDELRPVAGLIYRASDEVQALATSVREREARELVGSAQDFVRRRPLAFAAMTGLLGFAAVRLLTPIPEQDVDDDARDEDHDDYSEDDDSDYDENDGDGEYEDEDVTDRSVDRLPRSAFENPVASGDPGGVAPEAPGFGSVGTAQVADAAVPDESSGDEADSSPDRDASSGGEDTAETGEDVTG